MRAAFGTDFFSNGLQDFNTHLHQLAADRVYGIIEWTAQNHPTPKGRMIVLNTHLPFADATDTPVSPLNAIWLGAFAQRLTLPRLGHLFIVCPLEEAVVACAGAQVDSTHYLILASSTASAPYTLDNVRPNIGQSKLLLLLLSPAFMAEMAQFLNIPFEVTHLLHDVPLPQGDAISHVMGLIPSAIKDHSHCENLFMEAVGQVLRMLRLRHQTLMNLAHHKETTVHDLIPCLLRARQFIEAHFGEAIRTEDVARHVALSQYHFSRLFKAAFETTVHQYLMGLRLNKSRHLLELSTMGVTEIALTVGYSSLSAFIHAFRRYCGVTPSEYRSRFPDA